MWKLILEVPDFALFKEHGRSLRLNDEAERRLSAVAEQPMKDIIVVMRDTGRRLSTIVLRRFAAS